MLREKKKINDLHFRNTLKLAIFHRIVRKILPKRDIKTKLKDVRKNEPQRYLRGKAF